MEKTKKNNKGFSLVELIVVVLIMAIIAVSLAPQVMKWVDRSRQANDASNYEALYAAAQLSALAAPTASGTITMASGATTTTCGDDFEDAMDNNLPGWGDIEITSTATETAGTSFTITVSAGNVTRGTEPGEIDAD